jgi:excisionase family DNA binding protein
MANEQMLTTSEVAARLNVSLRRVRQLIEEGRLPSQQFGRDHLIKESDLSLVENRKVGRPPKAETETDSKASKKKSEKKR